MKKSTKRGFKKGGFMRIRRLAVKDEALQEEMIQTSGEMRELQQTVGNQQAVRLAFNRSAGRIARQVTETATAEQTEKNTTGEQAEMAAYRFAGARSRHVRSLEEDTHFQEARSTGMIEIRVWERRQSHRTLRTTEQSADFYDWLERKVTNFPGRMHLNDNQYWELSPGSGRLRLVTLNVVVEERGEEEGPPPPESAEAAEDPIYARYYAIYGPFAPWVAPEEARMRVQQADPEEARKMRARELMPQYLLWLSMGGERREEQYKVPATWYLSQQPDRASWSLTDYFTLKAMGQASERMRAMPVLAEASANLTNFILAFPVATIEEMAKEGIKIGAELFFDQIMDFLERNGVSREIVDSLRASKEILIGLMDYKKLFEALISTEPDVDKGQEVIDFVRSLFGHIGAVAQLTGEEGAPPPTVEISADDSGFWAECGQTPLQEKYFYHFVAGNIDFLQAYLAGMGVEDEGVYRQMVAEADRLRGANPLLEE